MDDILEAIAAISVILSRHRDSLWPDDEKVLQRALVVLNILQQKLGRR